MANPPTKQSVANTLGKLIVSAALRSSPTTIQLAGTRMSYPMTPGVAGIGAIAGNATSNRPRETEPEAHPQADMAIAAYLHAHAPTLDFSLPEIQRLHAWLLRRLRADNRHQRVIVAREQLRETVARPRDVILGHVFTHLDINPYLSHFLVELHLYRSCLQQIAAAYPYLDSTRNISCNLFAAPPEQPRFVRLHELDSTGPKTIAGELFTGIRRHVESVPAEQRPSVVEQLLDLSLPVMPPWVERPAVREDQPFSDLFAVLEVIARGELRKDILSPPEG